MPPPDYYAALQVDPAADPEVVEAAYRRRARKLHPDRNPDPDAHRSMQALNEAYGVLSDPARRAAYDGSRAAAPPPPAPGGDGAGGGPAAPVRFAPDLPAAAVVGLYAVALPVALGLLLYAAGLPGAGSVCGTASAAAFLAVNRRLVRPLLSGAVLEGTPTPGVLAGGLMGGGLAAGWAGGPEYWGVGGGLAALAVAGWLTRPGGGRWAALPAGQRASGRETAAALALAAAAVLAGVPLAGSSGEFGGRMGDVPYLGFFDRGRAGEARSVLSTADRVALGHALNKVFPPRTGVGVGFRPSWVGPGRVLEVTNDTPAWAGPVVVSVNGLRPRWAAGDVAPGGTVGVGWRRTGVALRPGDRVVVRVGSVTAAEAVVP